MELNRLKRWISRIKGHSESPEHYRMIQQQKALTAELQQVQTRRKDLEKQAIKVQVN